MSELKIQKLDESSSLVPAEMSLAMQENEKQFLENVISKIVNTRVMNYFLKAVDYIQDRC